MPLNIFPKFITKTNAIIILNGIFREKWYQDFLNSFICYISEVILALIIYYKKYIAKKLDYFIFPIIIVNILKN